MEPFLIVACVGQRLGGILSVGAELSLSPPFFEHGARRGRCLRKKVALLIVTPATTEKFIFVNAARRGKRTVL
jgi:hypothetical protein